MPLKMPTTTIKSKATGSEKLPENEYISCQQFNFRLRDVDAFLFQEAFALIPAQTVVYFKNYTASVNDSEKVLYNLLSKNFNCLQVK